MTSLTLPQLQNLIKRDPAGYQDEFNRQLMHFDSLFQIVKLEPSQPNEQFEQVAQFLAHVSNCFPQELIGYDFMNKLILFLKQNYSVINPSVRKALVQSLMLLRSKSHKSSNYKRAQNQHGKGIMEDPIPLLSLSFFLLKCRDKQLREMLKSYIISDIKALNAKGKNNKINKSLQNFMFSMISDNAINNHVEGMDLNGALDSGDASDVAAKYSLDICIELYKKQLWNDQKTVNIIADSLFSPHKKVLVTALKFFLGQDEDDEEEESDQEELPTVKSLKFRSTITKKSKSNKRTLEKSLKMIQKKQQQKEKPENFNFSALHLLNDPQSLCEKLFKLLTRGQIKSQETEQKIYGDLKFEVKLMVMNLISRLIGLHKLLVLNFYPFLMKFLKPKQQDITIILVILTQSIHSLIPPEEYLTPLIKTLINNFCTDSFSGEVIQAGINSIREICSRNPLAIDKEMLHYLCTFKSHREKGVVIACKSLINLFREVSPEMLPRKERGKTAQMELSHGVSKTLPKFGQFDAADNIPGTEMLDVLSDGDEDDMESLSDNDTSDDEGHVESKVMHLGLELFSKDQSSSSDQEAQDGVDQTDEEQVDLEDLELDEIEDEDEEILSQISDESEHSTKPSVPNTSVTSRVESERILTQEDFAKLKKLQLQKEAERKIEGFARKRKRDEDVDPEDQKEVNNNIVTASDILGFQKHKKQNYEERVAQMKEGTKDRPKFGSRKGKHNIDKGSTTNKQKSKGKNFMMMVHKKSIASKKKMSLRDKQKKLRQHIELQKKKGH